MFPECRLMGGIILQKVLEPYRDQLRTSIGILALNKTQVHIHFMPGYYHVLGAFSKSWNFPLSAFALFNLLIQS